MKVQNLLKKLNYLPRWSWYVLSLCIGGPVGPFVVYLVFHALEKAAKDEAQSERDSMNWDVDIDESGVHVRRWQGEAQNAGSARSRGTQRYSDADCTVTDDSEVDRQWRQTESSARQARASQQAAARQTPEPAIGEDATVADVVREGKSALVRIRSANDRIPDPALSAQIDSIENSCRQILSVLEQRPQLLSQLRTFLRYYLPTTLHLLEARAKLENTANTPKAREVRARISDALGVIDKAFLKQVEALDEYRFIDLESEMDVLRDMLRSDGLLDEEKEDDPFAQVLSQRASAKKQDSAERNIPLAGH